MTENAPTLKPSRAYCVLRAAFVVGLALSLIVYFVPCYKPPAQVLKAWLATGGVERRLSSFDLCRLLVRAGEIQWGAFYMALSAMELALLVLAVQRPRRWVFIAGACEQLYLLIVFLCRPASETYAQPSLTAFLGYAVWAMCLTGLFVKPPGPRVDAGSEVAAYAGE
jgi:hypothetical protein